ncbi:hypothetical protein F7725_016361 [Dissostichus mawsoni]|uniref:Uncharacterized protein n=1 Tax=Dissostichus mawsoni TaxID=36200 RepID=A0A7J5Z5P3_DISMA|nr:hypothetical protein F7725_016361 [Dissostichus mawsoni]
MRKKSTFSLLPDSGRSLYLNRGLLVQRLQELHTNSLSMDEYCEQLWYREKRRQQKLRALKLKQESRKARVRRHNPPEGPL